MISDKWNISPEEKYIISRHQVQPPIRVGQIAKDLGLEVIIVALPPKVSGEIRPSATSRAGYRIRVNRHEVKARQRFTIAHEIAHYLIHRDFIGDGIQDNILYRSTLSNWMEAQANQLAADIIMPQSIVVAELRKLGGRVSSETALSLAKIFEVSEPAMRIRIGL